MHPCLSRICKTAAESCWLGCPTGITPSAFPTSNWKGELTIPREVTLINTQDGIRLAQSPVKELESLRSELYSAANKVVGPSSPNLLKGMTSGAYEIEATLEIPAGSSVSEFGFNVREGADQKTVVGYKPGGSTMFVDRSLPGKQISPACSVRDMKRKCRQRTAKSSCGFWWMNLRLRFL